MSWSHTLSLSFYLPPSKPQESLRLPRHQRESWGTGTQKTKRSRQLFPLLGLRALAHTPQTYSAPFCPVSHTVIRQRDSPHSTGSRDSPSYHLHAPSCHLFSEISPDPTTHYYHHQPTFSSTLNPPLTHTHTNTNQNTLVVSNYPDRTIDRLGRCF